MEINFMLSIYRLQNVSQALTYYKEDNYYSKENQEEYSEWYGIAAEDLGLKGKVKLKDFNYILNGCDKDGKLLVNKKIKEQKLSYETYYNVKNEYNKLINSLNIEDKYKDEISIVIKKITESNDKIPAKIIDNYEKKFSSLINNSNVISIDKKDKFKSEFKKINLNYKKIADRRPAYDLTFSAPKSVSIAALVGDDKRLIDAHRNAVKYALSVVEKEYSQTRIVENKNRNIILTNNIIAATFEHDISRKIDPQLHTHCVMMNMTKNNGEWRSINQDGFYYSSKKLGAIYQNELAKCIKKLGYEIQLNPNGTFDIKGYTSEHLLHFSKRSLQMKEMGSKNQKDARKYVLIERDKKVEGIPKKLTYNEWKNEAKILNITHPISSNLNTFNDPNNINKNDILESIILNSIKELTENDISLKKDKLHEKILIKSLGIFDYNEETKVKTEEYLKKKLI
ncbi:relaxase domain-containing protein (plasmid) [Silvanigrella paludirubra]|uniref:Relaxase domain-containing protein n=2 Tax=Silvanigrella paludirubra TaxID=2499159 RepID=A0A6N6VTG9_9BACT|nr:relaxase domain-containing protein [Silvanigrella paludirubra]